MCSKNDQRDVFTLFDKVVIGVMLSAALLSSIVITSAFAYLIYCVARSIV